MRVARVGAALVGALSLIPLTTSAMAVTAAPEATATLEPPARHVVHAGWSNPRDGAEPFNYTSYFPSHLQVHRGDTVEWQFGEGYGGWHTVSFNATGETPPWFRTDEVPGTLGFGDDWLLGHERGDETRQCGRFSWLAAPQVQEACVLVKSQFDDPGEQFSSSLLDRFLSTADAGSFVAQVDLPEGTYTYFCKMHLSMRGTLEVVGPEVELANPTEAQLRAQRDADHANAVARRAELSGSAWNPITQEWTVHIGGETTDGRVGIYDYLPSRVEARRGDKVRFVAGTQEPNTVTFTSLPHGGFNHPGTCGTTSCSDDGKGLPFGLTGTAFPWSCDPDDTSTGAPGVPLASWVPSGVAYGPLGGAVSHGCVEPKGGPMTPEMAAGPTLTTQQRAPLDLVVDGDTFHNSGMLFDASLPKRLAARPDGTSFPSTFEARFPTAGTFAYVCIAHEFMKGQIDVI